MDAEVFFCLPPRYIFDISTKTGNQAFLSEFSDMVYELELISETDAPMTPFVWANTTEINDLVLLKMTGKPLNTSIEKRSVEEFFRNRVRISDWQSAQEKQVAERFALLYSRLRSCLSDLSVFKIGENPKIVLLMGMLGEGSAAGLQSLLVET